MAKTISPSILDAMDEALDTKLNSLEYRQRLLAMNDLINAFAETLPEDRIMAFHELIDRISNDHAEFSAEVYACGYEDGQNSTIVIAP